MGINCCKSLPAGHHLSTCYEFGLRPPKVSRTTNPSPESNLTAENYGKFASDSGAMVQALVYFAVPARWLFAPSLRPSDATLDRCRENELIKINDDTTSSRPFRLTDKGKLVLLMLGVVP